MIQQHRERGIDAAFQRFGLEKEAGFAQGLKTMLVGDPSRYLKELRAGSLFAPGGVIRQSMDPRISGVFGSAEKPAGRWGTAANAAFLYGLPAYSVYQAATAAPEQRGSAVGSAIGGAAGGVMGGPLGIAGQIGGSILGGSLGEALGRNFNRHTPRAPDPRPAEHPLSSEMSSLTGRPT
jgi:phage tail tape-measure protein